MRIHESLSFIKFTKTENMKKPQYCISMNKKSSTFFCSISFLLCPGHPYADSHSTILLLMLGAHTSEQLIGGLKCPG